MTKIDFYSGAEDKLRTACELSNKSMQSGLRVMLHTPDAATTEVLDKLLWCYPALSFIPHCYAHDPLAAATPVLIAAGDEPMTPASAACEVLLNLAAECPPFFERHERLLEIVAQDDEERRAGRARYAFYRDRGYEIRNHDLAISA